MVQYGVDGVKSRFQSVSMEHELNTGQPKVILSAYMCFYLHMRCVALLPVLNRSQGTVGPALLLCMPIVHKSQSKAH
jgi:hypothetical protein